MTLRGRCRGGPPEKKCPLGLPELVSMYKHINTCMPEDDDEPGKILAPVDVFAQSPGSRNAFEEYFGGIHGRVEILRSNPRTLSNPAGVVYTFTGLRPEHSTRQLGYPVIPTTFDKHSTDHYQRLHETFNLPYWCSEGDMQRLQSLIAYEIRYLRGCDLQWVPEPAGKFYSLAMLQDKALTAHVRAGETGDESSSSVEFMGLDEPRRPPPPPRRLPRCSQPPRGGVMVPAFTAGDDSDTDETLTIVEPPKRRKFLATMEVRFNGRHLPRQKKGS